MLTNRFVLESHKLGPEQDIPTYNTSIASSHKDGLSIKSLRWFCWRVASTVVEVSRSQLSMRTIKLYHLDLMQDD